MERKSSSTVLSAGPHDPMHCPRCATPTLYRQRRCNIDVDVCRTCQGIWLDRGELETLTNYAEVQAGYIDDLADDGDLELWPAQVQSKRRPAPPTWRRR